MFKMHQNSWWLQLCPILVHWELTALPQTPSWWGEDSLPVLKSTPHQPFGIQALALRVSQMRGHNLLLNSARAPQSLITPLLHSTTMC